jgi:hypothetical protein
MADKLDEQLQILLQKCKLNDIVSRVRRAIDQAYVSKAREIIDSLHQNGLLEKLGKFSSPDIEEKVNELATILPHSKEFIHVS